MRQHSTIIWTFQILLNDLGNVVTKFLSTLLVPMIFEAISFLNLRTFPTFVKVQKIKEKLIFKQLKNILDWIKSQDHSAHFRQEKECHINRNKGVITCFPSTVSKPRRCSSQSASRGRPSSHNSPFTVLTNAPFTLQNRCNYFTWSKNRRNRRHCCIYRTLCATKRGVVTPAVPFIVRPSGSWILSGAPAWALFLLCFSLKDS